MLSDAIAARRLKTVIEEVIRCNERKQDVVSMKVVIAGVRQLNRSPVSDAALSEVIARCAGQRGMHVMFGLALNASLSGARIAGR